MYCPECGADAAEANYCPQCGNDLTSLGGGARMAGACPECGTDAGKAKFCPECGHQIPKPSRQAGGHGQRARNQRPRAARRAAARQEPPAAQRSRTPVAFIWGAFALAAIVVVIIVASTAGGGGSGGGGSAATAPEAVPADTSGSYSELVERANGLYDQGIEAFNKDDAEGGVAYFKAASEVYRAAWKKQPGDPSVGTDFAVALFYMRHHDEGIKQIDVVIKKNPDFQAAHLNKGIFLKTEASEAKDKAKSADYLAQAKLAFQKAVSIDPSSEAGKNAAQALQSL
jgi:tetratricopeptide (TPR) repeat protein